MIQQLNLSIDLPENQKFDGATFDPAKDAVRLGKQLTGVLRVMSNGDWLSLTNVQDILFDWVGLYASETSISARIRDLRKPKFGGYTVERRRVGNLYQYRLVL